VVILLSRSPSHRELLEGLRGYFIILLFVQAKAAWIEKKPAGGCLQRIFCGNRAVLAQIWRPAEEPLEDMLLPVEGSRANAAA